MIFTDILVFSLATLWIFTIIPAPSYLFWLLKLIFTELWLFPYLICGILAYIEFFLYKNYAMALTAFVTAIAFSRPFLLYKWNKVERQWNFKLEFKNKIQNTSSIKPRTNIACGKFVYGKGLNLHIYTSSKINSEDEAIPCILVVHGGAWRSGSATDFQIIHKSWVKNGYIVGSASYRLAPNYHFPEQREDIIEAVYAFRTYLKKVGMREEKISLFLLGRSAGGQLAGVAAAALGNQIIKGLILLYTPIDLVWGYDFPGNPWVLNSREVLQQYLGATPHVNKSTYEAASLNYIVHEKFPPTLMIHGAQDDLVAPEHNFRLMDALQPFNIPYRYILLKYATHGMDYFPYTLGNKLTNQHIFHFIEQLK